MTRAIARTFRPIILIARFLNLEIVRDLIFIAPLVVLGCGIGGFAYLLPKVLP